MCTMQKQATVEELKRLPSVGETTAHTLKEKGYGSFPDLVRANPMDLHQSCNIVLSSATHIISAAVEHLDGRCPSCGNSDTIENEWREYSGSIPDDDSIEIICSNCNWYGNIEDLRE